MKKSVVLAQEQINLVQEIQEKCKINIVNCGNCGSIILHKLDAENIECHCCGLVSDHCDCPDLWYDGVIENLYDNRDKTKTKEIVADDVIKVANDLDIKLTNEKIDFVLCNYDNEANDDPSATWDLIVENLLYNFE